MSKQTWGQWAAARPARHWFGEGIIAASLCLFAASAYFNAKFNASMAVDETSKHVMSMAGVAIASLLALLAIGKRFLSTEEQKGALRKAGLLIALLAAWEVWSAMGHISTNRGDSVANRVHEKQTYSANASELPKLQAERDAIKARPAGQIQGAIDALIAKNPASMEKSKNCSVPAGAPGTCSKLAGLRAEHGASQRKEALDNRIAKLMDSNASASGRVEAEADPQAAAASSMLGLLGIKGDSNAIAKLAPVLLALVLMIGGWWGTDLGFLIRGIHLGDEPAAAQPSAEIIHPQFAQPKPTAVKIDGSTSLIDAARAKMTGTYTT